MIKIERFINRQEDYFAMFHTEERIKEALTGLGWSIDYKVDHIYIEKGPRDTTMTGHIHVAKDFIVGEIQDPDGNVINGWRTDNTLDDLGRLAFGIMESYLSGATNIKEIHDVYKRYRIKPKQPDSNPQE